MNDVWLGIVSTVLIAFFGWLIKIEIRLSRIEGMLKLFFYKKKDNGI